MADFNLLNETDYPKEPTILPSSDSAGFIDPYKISTGVLRGTQTIIDTDGSKIEIGKLKDSDNFGIAFYDSSGNLVNKIVGPTTYVYDVSSAKNIIQMGKLPDGTYGLAVVKTGYDISDAIT